MMLIARVISREILKDREITDLKPQNPIAPTITMDVPSSLWLLALPILSQLLLLHPALLPPQSVFLGCSRVCFLGAVTLVSVRTCS
jgi:hypothetical protein